MRITECRYVSEVGGYHRVSETNGEATTSLTFFLRTSRSIFLLQVRSRSEVRRVVFTSIT